MIINIKLTKALYTITVTIGCNHCSYIATADGHNYKLNILRVYV